MSIKNMVFLLFILPSFFSYQTVQAGEFKKNICTSIKDIHTSAQRNLAILKSHRYSTQDLKNILSNTHDQKTCLVILANKDSQITNYENEVWYLLGDVLVYSVPSLSIFWESQSNASKNIRNHSRESKYIAESSNSPAMYIDENGDAEPVDCDDQIDFEKHRSYCD